MIKLMNLNQRLLFVVRIFCKYHNINVTHGSPYKELRHKYYYYLDKYIKNLLDNKTDLYKLRENHVITDKEIVDRILRKG